MFADIFRWWITIQALGLLALPLTVWFFRRFPDRGYSFAKPFGLLLVGYGAWLLSMLGLGSFGRFQLIAVALVIGVGGLALLGRSGRTQAVADMRARLGWIGFQEALFAVALYFGLWLRWHEFFGFGAALQHTEQPMDLTFLSGILASRQFPPQDPWLTPYPINYYYLGFLLVAVVARLTELTPGEAYTLGMATIFALTATGIAGMVRNLIDLSHDHAAALKPHADHAAAVPASGARRGWGRWIVPLIGVVLVLVVGNQAGTLQILAGSEKVVALAPGEVLWAIRNNLGPREALQLPPSFPAKDFGDQTQLIPENLASRATFDRWWPSRAVWDDLRGDNGEIIRYYNITEFPFFSFLLGDLHPHVLALPWALLALACALNVLLRDRAPDFRSRGGIVQLVVTAIVLGSLYAINSWDLPTYLLIYLGALTLLYLRLATSLRRFFWAHWAQQAGITVLASYMLYIPFYLSFSAPTAPEGQSPVALVRARTSLLDFLIMFGLFFVPLAAYVIRMARAPRAEQQPAQNLASLSTLLILGGLLLLGIVVGWPLFVLLPFAVWACFTAYDRRDQPATAFALWVFAVAALVIWATDIVYLRDIYANPRMNTIFKFYYQVWLLWAMLAAYALWALAQRIRWTSLLWLAPTLLLFLSAFTYPVLAPKTGQTERTLDGLAYLEREAPGEAAAIDWIRQNTAPDAVIVQATGKQYNPQKSRISSATGRPTILGWDGHERIWRRTQEDVVAQIAEREQDINTIYSTLDPLQAQALLDKYNAQYVYVGPNERALAQEQGAPPQALEKFDQFMTPVFQRDDVVLYARR